MLSFRNLPLKVNLKIHQTNRSRFIRIEKQQNKKNNPILLNLFGYEGFSLKLLAAQWYPFHASHNIAEPLKMIFLKGVKLCVGAENAMQCQYKLQSRPFTGASNFCFEQKSFIFSLIFPILSPSPTPFLVFC